MVKEMKTPSYQYRAFVSNVVDGDTIDAFVILQDYGFRKYEMAIERFRLANIDTWEVRGEEREKGLAAKARVEDLILNEWVTITSEKRPGKYGRWLGTIFMPHMVKAFDAGEVSSQYLHEVLRHEGHEKIRAV